MNKVTTSSHPLAGLRAICGFTREDVAKIAGISAASVQNIELGRAPMPEDAARRIEAATGCRASSLMEKQSTVLRLDGKPYAHQSYLNYQKSSTATLEGVEAVCADLQFRLRTLLAASAEGKFLYVARRIGDALDAVLNEAGISMESLESVERHSASVGVQEMTVAQLQQEIGDSPIWKKKLATHPQPAKGKCKVVLESYQHWPSTDLQNHIVYAKTNIRSRYRIEFADGERVEVLKDQWKMNSISGKDIPLPKEGDKLATVPSPALAKKNSRKKARKR